MHSGGLDWHVQCFGDSGPTTLLLHGTAASTHSWAALAPLLAHHFRIIAADLPGHAFTSPKPDDGSATQAIMTLPGMANAVAALMRTMNFSPELVIGHSAGAAVLTRMSLDGTISPKVVISLNGALLPFGSIARYMLPVMARLLFRNSLVPWIFSRQASDRSNVERLIVGTGSRLSDAQLDHYVRLFRSSGHVEAALSMMANWDLPALERELPKLTTPLVLVSASEDVAVPPEKAADAKRLVPAAQIEYLRGLGHLAHEEDPHRVAQLIVAIARRHGVPLPAAN